MQNPNICSEDEISQLVESFYQRVRDDGMLGPIFSEHVDDWPSHLGKMVDFWSSTLRGTARFRGSPMIKHQGIEGITDRHFQRWLQLFHETTANIENAALRERANQLSSRIAESLWYGYQLNRGSDQLPRNLGTLQKQE